MTPWRWAVLVLVLTAVLYGPHILRAEWVYEDLRWQSHIAQPMPFGAPRSLTSQTWPLTTTPPTAHALSVSLHLGAVVLLALLAARMGLSQEAVALTALLALVHPLTIEAVAYAAARDELLCAIGILIALVAAAGQWWTPRAVMGMAAGVVIAWLSKESAVVLLGLLPLTWGVRRMQMRPPVRAWVGGLGSLLLLALTGWWAGGHTLSGWANLGEAVGLTPTWSDWLLLQSAAAYRLIGLTLWPVGLTVDYDYDLIPRSLQALAVLALLALSATTIWLARVRPLLAYGLAWCLLSLLPRLVIQTPRSYLAEHQFYVPLLGLVLGATATWDQWRAQVAT